MTILIKGGLMYDGSGMAPFVGDVLIRGSRIAHVGEIPRVRADLVVDAGGAMVTPGFIDVGGEVDHYLTLFSEPHAEHFLRQGITTVIGGNGGVSLAPLLDGSLCAVERWVSTEGVNVHWRTVREFLALLTTRGLGINFGTLAGHATVRRALTRDVFRDLTEGECAMLGRVLSRACVDGAFGISVDLGDAHERQTPFRELRTLASVAARSRRILALRLRRTDDAVAESVGEALRLAKEEEVSMEISGLTPLAGHGEAYGRALALIDEATAAVNVHFDLCPCERIPVPLTALLPDWLRAAAREETLRYLRTSESVRRVAAHLERFRAVPFSIAYVPERSLASFEGKVLGELALHGHQPFGRALLSFMNATDLRAVLTAPLADPHLLGRYLAHERALVSTGGLPRGPHTFVQFLKAARGGALPVERAVEKLTSLAAKKFGVAKRGMLAPGYHADAVVMRDGIPRDVLVNGRFVIREGRTEPVRAGTVLRPSPRL